MSLANQSPTTFEQESGLFEEREKMSVAFLETIFVDEKGRQRRRSRRISNENEDVCAVPARKVLCCPLLLGSACGRADEHGPTPPPCSSLTASAADFHGIVSGCSITRTSWCYPVLLLGPIQRVPALIVVLHKSA